MFGGAVGGRYEFGGASFFVVSHVPPSQPHSSTWQAGPASHNKL